VLAQSAEQCAVLGDYEREPVRRLLDSAADLADRLVEPGSYGIVANHVLTRRTDSWSPSTGRPRASQSTLPGV
jgi:hypothetical protein